MQCLNKTNFNIPLIIFSPFGTRAQSYVPLFLYFKWQISLSIFATDYRKLHQAYCKIKSLVANNQLLLNVTWDYSSLKPIWKGMHQ
jgi:hypothetical protein